MILMDIAGQVKIVDRTAGAIAAFTDIHKRLESGELDLPKDLADNIRELWLRGKSLISVRLATPRELQELHQSAALVMDASPALCNIMAGIRHIQAEKEKPKEPRPDPKRFVQ